MQVKYTRYEKLAVFNHYLALVQTGTRYCILYHFRT